MQPLLPTLKEKKRYLTYKIASVKSLGKDVSQELLAAIQQKLGLFESAHAGIMLIKYDKKTQRGVIKMSHKYVEKVKTSMMLINSLDEEEIAMSSLGVSGILKKTDKWYTAG